MHNLLLYSFGKSKGPTAKQIQSLLRGLSSSKLMETKFPMFKFLIFKVYFPPHNPYSLSWIPWNFLILPIQVPIMKRLCQQLLFCYCWWHNDEAKGLHVHKGRCHEAPECECRNINTRSLTAGEKEWLLDSSQALKRSYSICTWYSLFLTKFHFSQQASMKPT